METVTGRMIYRHFYVRVPDGPHMGLSGFKKFHSKKQTQLCCEAVGDLPKLAQHDPDANRRGEDKGVL